MPFNPTALRPRPNQPVSRAWDMLLRAVISRLAPLGWCVAPCTLTRIGTVVSSLLALTFTWQWKHGACAYSRAVSRGSNSRAGIGARSTLFGADALATAKRRAWDLGASGCNPLRVAICPGCIRAPEPRD